MNRGVYHPAGCRCQGCIPAQYRPRTQPARRPAPPAKRQPGWCLTHGILAGVILAGWGLWEILIIPARIWHTTGPSGNQIPSPTAWIMYGVIAVVLALLVKAALVARDRRRRPPKPPAPSSRRRCPAFTGTPRWWSPATT